MTNVISDWRVSMENAFPYDACYKKKAIITGCCALERNGLIYASSAHLDLQTTFKELDGLQTCICNFYYNPEIDWDYLLCPMKSNPLLLLPSKERALIECIQHLDWVDEGFLIEALKTYLNWFKDDDRLYACADHFGVSRETVNYWINEALTDEEV